jgi:hypothetical protein
MALYPRPEVRGFTARVVNTFRWIQLVQTGPEGFRVGGLFTIRGATKPEELKLTLSRHGTGTIAGQTCFTGKSIRMNSGIASIRVVNRIFQGFSRHASG